MLVEVYDDDVPAVLWLFCGPSNDDADFTRWLSSMERLDRATGGRPGAALLIIDPDNPPPPKQHRDGITATARKITGKTPLAVVTSSSMARTIIAGLHLARVVGFPVKGFADVDAALAWLSARGAPARTTGTAPVTATTTTALRAMEAEARARAARAAVEKR